MKKFCAFCEKPFQSQRSSRLYCSDNCKQYAYYKRNASVFQGRDAGVALNDERDAKDVKHSNRSALMIKLNAILNNIIDEEVERRIAHKPHADTVKESVNVKRHVTVNDNRHSHTNDGNAKNGKANTRESNSVNRNVMLYANHERFNVKQHDNYYNDVNAENSNADAIESDSVNCNVALNGSGNHSTEKPFNGKRYVTLNDNHDEHPNEDEPEDNEAVEPEPADNESDVMEDGNCEDERSIVKGLLNVKRLMVNGNQQEYINEDEPEDNERDAIEDEDYGDDELNIKRSLSVKRHVTVNGNQQEYINEDEPEGNEDDVIEDDDYKDEVSATKSRNVNRIVTLNDKGVSDNDQPADNELNLNELDQMIEDIKQKVQHLREQHKDAKDCGHNTVTVKPLNVKPFVTESETVNAKKTYFEIPTPESSLNDDQKIKHHTGVDKNWVFSNFTRYIHDYDFYLTDYSKFTDSNSRKILEVFKCLAKHLLCLSNRKPISRHNLLVLTTIITRLTKSNNFKYLSGRFPHCELIISLTEKLQALEMISRKQKVKLRFTLKFRTKLYAILYAMSDDVKDRHIGEIRFGRA